MHGSNILVELPADPFSESNWSKLDWSFRPPPKGPGGPPRQKFGHPSSKIRISNPIAATLTPDDAEGDLRAFIRDQGAVFDIVHFACGFKPIRNEQYNKADLVAHLGLGGSPIKYVANTIAWSMQPLVRTAGGDRTTTVRLGADLKFVNFGIDQSRLSPDQACIQASGELSESPSWEIRRTQAYALNCDERFTLIVRRERGTPLYVSLELRAYGTRGKVFRSHFEGTVKSSL